MVQINDDYFEDLTPENFTTLLDNLAAGRAVTIGSQTGRNTSEPAGHLTTLVSFYGENGKSGPDVGPSRPTPNDFPGENILLDQPPGAAGAREPASEAAMMSLAREQRETVGRPDPGGQRGEPRQENPVHENAQRQDAAAHDEAKKS